MFYSDLVRMIQVPLTIDFITASSYLKTISTEKVSIHCDIREDVRGKDVLLIEDIADSGITLNYTVREYSRHRPTVSGYAYSSTNVAAG